MLAKKLHLEAPVLACMIFGLISVQGKIIVTIFIC